MIDPIMGHETNFVVAHREELNARILPKAHHLILVQTYPRCIS